MMPSWNDSEESGEEEFIGMDMELWAHQEESAKLKKELDSLGTQYSQPVEDVTKLFDWRDAEQQKKVSRNDKDLQKKEMDGDK
ncbi:putative polyprotein [Hordeum vulgare]|nr:putative polyprotein [Hordeum vulgare]